MARLRSIVRKIDFEMRRYKFTRLLYDNSGLINLKLYLSSLWFYNNPSQEMENEREIFTDHTQELKTVYNSLEDDRSKSVFENILKYRVTYKWEYLKKAALKDNEKTQYLAPEIPFSNHEVIVDCGAYIGDTVKCFFKKIPGCRVIALEPDEKNFKSLQKLRLEGLKVINAGAWSEDTTLSFSNRGGGTGSTKIDVIALDHLPECQSATYIKMNIEGAELEALKGAEKIIKERRPKLAICIYHRPQDYFEIPLYIKSLNSDYRLFIHHHSNGINETVLYAV